MRALVPRYEMDSVRTLDEALRRLDEKPGAWRPFAGGTDLMVVFEAGRLAHTRYLDILALDELRGIQIDDTQISIGALTTYSEIRAHAQLGAELPLLPQAARLTGAIAIQNRGTLGGNIANASPAADTPPALLAYDAELEIVSARGTRRLPLAQFYQGYKQTALAPHELIARVWVKRAAERRHFYRKVGTRKAQAISKLCLAATAQMRGGVVEDLRLAWGSVGPYPLRSLQTETALRGQALSSATIARARQALAQELKPIADVRSTAEYRRDVALNLLEEFLTGLA